MDGLNAHNSPVHLSMVRERVKVTCIPRLRCCPAQLRHTKDPCATDAQSAQGAPQSAQRLQTTHAHEGFKKREVVIETGCMYICIWYLPNKQQLIHDT